MGSSCSSGFRRLRGIKPWHMKRPNVDFFNLNQGKKGHSSSRPQRPMDAASKDDEDFIIDVGDEAQREHNSSQRTNSFTTSRYTMFSFVPLTIVMNFRRLGNLYFLIITILMLVGTYSPGFQSPLPPWGTLATLCVMVGFNMVVEGIDDGKRHALDRVTNNQSATRVEFENGDEIESTWGKLVPGDVVKVSDKEQVPVDMLLLYAKDKANLNVQCYCSTMGIDGETNLKVSPFFFLSFDAAPRTHSLTRSSHSFDQPPQLRSVHKRLVDTVVFPHDVTHLKGMKVKYERPTPTLSFRGSFTLPGAPEGSEDADIPIDFEHLLLRGATLRNTEYIYGLVLYVGKETKGLSSQTEAPLKVSKTERTMNSFIIYILLLLLLLVIMGTAFQMNSTFVDRNAWYFKGALLPVPGGLPLGVNAFLSFVILFKNILPILLYVCNELTSLAGAYFIRNDTLMYHTGTEKPAECKSTSLAQEVGQVQWIFTDKTGTLTRNEMRLVACSVNGEKYGAFSPAKLAGLADDEGVAPEKAQRELFSDLLSASRSAEQQMAIYDFLNCLSLCHTVMINPPEEDEEEKNATSTTLPDTIEEHSTSATPAEGDRESLLGNQPLVDVPKAMERQVSAASSAGSVVSQRKLDKRSQFRSSRSSVRGSQLLNRSTISTRSLLEGPATVVLDPNAYPDVNASWNSESPDETALVDAAANLGHRFVDSTSDGILLIKQWDRRDVNDEEATTPNVTTRPGIIPESPAASSQHLESKTIVDRKIRADKVKQYKLLATNPFDSTRKRMSVVVRRLSDGRIFSMCKGADNVMLPLLRMSEDERTRLEEDIDAFARTGLRTLVVAKRELEEEFFSEWIVRYEEAANLPADERKKALGAVGNEVEEDLVVVGATGIEDRLQEGVPDAIYRLRKTRIPLWILTGDKLETAIEIGYSSKLLDATSKLVLVTRELAVENVATCMAIQQMEGRGEFVAEDLPRFTTGVSGRDLGANEDDVGAAVDVETQHEENDFPTPDSGSIAMIVTGKALQGLLSTENGSDASEAEFMNAAKLAKVLICCRVSPAQKASLVRMVRTRIVPEPVTLAVGDGANDVPMIQEAKVGVGVYGHEGNQAVNSADFALGQFRFLVPLLLVHGRWNYKRTAKVITLIVYSSILFTMTTVYYNFFNGFSGGSTFGDFFYTIWSVFVALPAVAIGVFNRDYGRWSLITHPTLYDTGRLNTLLTNGQLMGHIFRASVHAFISMVYLVFFSDWTISLFVMGSALYICIVFVFLGRSFHVADSYTVIFFITMSVTFVLLLVLVPVGALIQNELPVIFTARGAQDTWAPVFITLATATLVEIIVVLVQRDIKPKRGPHNTERVPLVREVREFSGASPRYFTSGAELDKRKMLKHLSTV